MTQKTQKPTAVWSGAARLFVLLLLVAVVVACGRNEEPAPAPADTPTTAPEPTPTTAPAAPTEAPEPTAAPAEAPTAFESPLQPESPLPVPAVAPVSPLPTPPAVAADTGAILGRIISATQPGNPPLGETVVKPGQVIWRDDGSDGDFAIDAARGPSTISQPDGTFIVNDLPPGDYVLVVGDLIGKYEVLTTPAGEAQLFKVNAGEATDTGNLFVNLP